MAFRTPPNQNYHDRVIEIAAERLKQNFRVYTNPGSYQNTRIGNLFPDIILTPLNSNNVQHIIEVETSDSVNVSEVNQWKQYSTLGGTFYLMVPQGDRVKAENLCRTYGIYSVKFATYWVDGNNNLQLHYE